MKTILELDQHKLGLFSPTDGDITFTRRAARAVAIDENKRVALIRLAKTNTYKLPGGGIDEGEETLDALRREVKEEIGYEVSQVMNELGIVEEDRYYAHMHQTSYAYLVRVGAFVGTEPTEKEVLQGIETEWFESIDAAITHINMPASQDEDGSEIGRVMMCMRDTAILESARKLV